MLEEMKAKKAGRAAPATGTAKPKAIDSFLQEIQARQAGGGGPQMPFMPPAQLMGQSQGSFDNGDPGDDKLLHALQFA